MDWASVVIGGLILVLVVIVALWVLMSLFRAPLEGTERAIWLLIILAFPVVGAFIWLSWGQDSVARRPRS
ncbi:PLDc N-terminal domain-containing protein [Cryobacterium ruanii]|nr:PLDc N-terminal domain-containing protein [Cryobacterium ruanii]